MSDLLHLVDGDMEAVILGTILNSGEPAHREVAFLTHDDFAIERHKLIWRAIGQISADVHPTIDAVSERLSEDGKLEAAGGVSGLVDIHGRGMPGLPLAGFARGLQTKAAERRAFRVISKLSNLAELGLRANVVEVDGILNELRALSRGEGANRPTVTGIEELPPVGELTEPIVYLRNPEAPIGCIVGLTGDSGSGKSTVATAWIRDANAQGIPALVLDRENPRPVIIDRMGRLGLADSVLLRWYGGWNGEIPSPASREVIEWVRSCEPRPLILVDSLIAFLAGDENDAAVMRGFMNGARQLTNLGATVIVIHHDGKAETARDFRGSSDFKASLDQAFHVTNISSDGKLDRLSLRCYKSRYGFTGSLVYRYASGLFIRDERIDAPAVVAADQLTALLRTNPGIGTKEFEDLAAKANLGRNRARDFLSNGVLAGTIRRETAGRNRQHHFPVEVQN
jgi:hypothetical protein